MKLIALSVATVLLATTAHAAAPDKAELKRCTDMSTTAAGVMKARQHNVPMAKLMAIESGSKEFDDVMAEMVKDAFRSSAFSSVEYQNNAIREFENKWFGMCIN